MAQASSAQREPSMEEILASIRRIIEDSDTVRKDVSASAAREPHLRAVEQLEDPQVEAESFTPEVSAANEDRPSATEPLTLAAIKADFDSSAAGTAAHLAARTDAMNAGAFEGPGASAELSAVEDGPAEETEMEAALASAVEVEAAKDDPQQPMASRAGEASATVAPRAEAGTSGHAAEVQAEPARQTILSEHTSRQVAAAFGELSDAFAASRRRSFDEIAEEMLRPMLQEWLDNNLPVLVERLVREEIERVARGG